MIDVAEVRTKEQLRAFVQFQNDLYASCPQYVPTLLADEMLTLDKAKNPAYEYCETRMFIASRDGRPVGRICALVNNRYNQLWSMKRMRFCRFDVVDDLEVTRALFAKVEEWALERGLDEVIGPIGFCDLDKEGMLVEGFDEPSMYITLYNHPYYPRHLEALGYAKEADWVEYRIRVGARNERVARIASAVARRLKLHTVALRSRRDIDPHLRPVFELINEAYKPLFGTVPLTDKQIDFYVKQFRPLIDPRLISLVYDEAGKLVAFGLALPSLSAGVRRSRGHLLPFGIVHILLGMRSTRILDLYLIGVLPEYQGKGVNALIMNQIQDYAVGRFDIAETGPELELNLKVQAQWGDYETKQHKRRRCFVKRLVV